MRKNKRTVCNATVLFLDTAQKIPILGCMSNEEEDVEFVEEVSAESTLKTKDIKDVKEELKTSGELEEEITQVRLLLK